MATGRRSSRRAATGLGVARRYSTTVRADLLYVAVPVNNPAMPALGFVRLALPLTDVAEQLAAVRRSAFVAFGVGLVAALLLAWMTSMLLSRRVLAIAAVAERYARGDWSRPARDYGNDEIGTVGARAGRSGAGNRPARHRSRLGSRHAWKRSWRE